jgi:parallel beta-helix repeat protein
MRPQIPFLAAMFCAVLPAQMIEVSPGGPVRTLAEARDRARAARTPGSTAVVTIRVHAGTYLLADTLALGPQDSNTIWEAAPGERVVISGGRLITGWTKAATGPAWSAPVEPGASFRQLFVGGRRAQRARTPNNGFFRVDGKSSQDKPIRLHYRNTEIKKEWAARGDVEVIALFSWSDIRMPIRSVDEEAHIATLAGDPRPSNQEADARYYIENAPDALDSAGEWYLDKQAGRVQYRPFPGEDMATEQVMAPALTQLVRIEGKPEAGAFVRNVTFRGLEFDHADWAMDPNGYADTQAASPAGAAFQATGALDTTIDRCTFAHSGGYAVWFGRGSKRNRVLASEIYDMGGGGVKIGEPDQREADAEQNFDNTVADNHIHDLGLVYAPAVGVWVLQSSRNQILHNHIHDLFYTAISVGWTWGYGTNQSKGNIVAFNHLHNVGKGMLSDMGAIYTLGIQPGSELRNNLIHDVDAFTYGGWGIYPDEGTSEMLIENNVVYNCKSAGFHQHYGRENIVRNNVFAFNREFQLMRSRVEPHVSFTFERNIVIFDQGRLLGSNWTGDKYRMRGNIYWDQRGSDIRFAGKSLADWKKSGQDETSVIADPGFVNAANFDFRLRADSTALKMGFQPIDISTVGPRVIPGAMGR